MDKEYSPPSTKCSITNNLCSCSNEERKECIDDKTLSLKESQTMDYLDRIRKGTLASNMFRK